LVYLVFMFYVRFTGFLQVFTDSLFVFMGFVWVFCRFCVGFLSVLWVLIGFLCAVFGGFQLVCYCFFMGFVFAVYLFLLIFKGFYGFA